MYDMYNLQQIEIKNRWDGTVIYAGKYANIGEAVRAAVAKRVSLRNSDLSNSDLRDSDLRNSDLRGSDLRNSDLSGSDLSGSDLRGSDLRGSDLRNSDLRVSDLRGSDLRVSDLSGSDLRNSDLRNSDLSGSDLRNSDLRGSDLSGSLLRGCKNLNAYSVTPLLMLRDQPGLIRLYKLVTPDGDEPHLAQYHGHTINYLASDAFEVENINTDPCARYGAGINVATLDRCMQEWQDGCRILIVEFAADDIACIPTATDGKVRLHRCRRVGEVDLVEIGLIKPETENMEIAETIEAAK
jgi:hypothetical protein